MQNQCNLNVRSKCILNALRIRKGPCLRKETVNSNVLSLNLKLFRTKVEIKSVIRDYLLGNYVVNV